MFGFRSAVVSAVGARALSAFLRTLRYLFGVRDIQFKLALPAWDDAAAAFEAAGSVYRTTSYNRTVGRRRQFSESPSEGLGRTATDARWEKPWRER